MDGKETLRHSKDPQWIEGSEALQSISMELIPMGSF